MMIGVKGKQLCAGNRMQPDRRTDGQTDMVIPVYPPNFVAGGIITPSVYCYRNLSGIVKITPTCKVYLTFLQNSPPPLVKITTFTVYRYRYQIQYLFMGD